MRSGTLPAPLIVGLGTACRVAGEEMEVGAQVFFFFGTFDLWLFCPDLLLQDVLYWSQVMQLSVLWSLFVCCLVAFSHFHCLFSLQYDTKRIVALSNRLVKGLESNLEHIVRNGDRKLSYPGN